MKRRKDGRFLKVVTIDGEKAFFYSSESTERKAENDIARQMVEYQKRKTEEKNMLFADVADAWDSEYRLQIPEITYRKGIKAQYLRILDYFDGYRINDITPQDINRFIRSLNYGYKTVAGHKSTLNMIFEYAILHGYTQYNPVTVVKVPKNLERHKRELPTSEELRIVSEHWEGFDLLPYFLLWTGCRKSEALAIKREDIDFENRIIKIRNHVIHDGNKPIYESVLKSEAARRDVIITDNLYQALPKKFSGFLFSASETREKPLSKGEFDKRWKKYCERYNLHITAHQLRHGFATMLFEANVDIKDTQVLMGHSDINLTRSVYTHIRDVRKEETAKKINSFKF